MALGDSGDVYVAGIFAPGRSGWTVTKLTSEGDRLWDIREAVSYEIQSLELGVDAADNSYVTAHWPVENGAWKVLFLKVDPGGRVLRRDSTEFVGVTGQSAAVFGSVIDGSGRAVLAVRYRSSPSQPSDHLSLVSHDNLGVTTTINLAQTQYDWIGTGGGIGWRRDLWTDMNDNVRGCTWGSDPSTDPATTVGHVLRLNSLGDLATSELLDWRLRGCTVSPNGKVLAFGAIYDAGPDGVWGTPDDQELHAGFRFGSGLGLEATTPFSADGLFQKLVADHADNVFAIDLNGSLTDLLKFNDSWQLVWRRPLVVRWEESRIFIDRENSTYFSDGMGRLYRLDAGGREVWSADLPGAGVPQELLFDDDLNVYVLTGDMVVKYGQSAFDRPAGGDHFLPGRRDSIQWHGGPAGRLAKLEYSTDLGLTYHFLADVPADTATYYWDVPDTLLTPKAKVRLRDPSTGDPLRVSGRFNIKPYVITRLDANGDYVVYDIETDRWGFANKPEDVWPKEWWERFDYWGEDELTGLPFDLTTAGGAFAFAQDSDHPDWTSWVGAFGYDACYAPLGHYRLLAVERWDAWKRKWGGSCFGIAISNALVFENRSVFQSRYQTFPNLAPIDVQADDTVIPRTVNELFTHQAGNPHRHHKQTIAKKKTPNETLADLKSMLSTNETMIQTLSFLSNNPVDPGGHAILAYGLEQDATDEHLWYISAYDNSHSNNTNAKIRIDTTGSGGKGTWEPLYGWAGWGGDKWIYLRDPASNYLTEATFPAPKRSESPFILRSDQLEVYAKGNDTIAITEPSGQQTGFSAAGLIVDIPGSTPLIVENGSSGPPIGYELLAGSYEVSLADFSADTVKAFFFTGNRAFDYQRAGASDSQTDHLRFDGALLVRNEDPDAKTVRLLNIVSDPEEERLLVTRGLSLAQGDSIRLENLDGGRLRLVSDGEPRSYSIGMEYVSDAKRELFEHNNIGLAANTSHTFVPDWPDIGTGDLVVYVDVGDDGVIEDTLTLGNEATGYEEQGFLDVPGKYGLGQNYPNPLSSVTTITYALPRNTEVTLTVYDVLGRTVRELSPGAKPAGVHEVTFDAAGLPSGVYFYRLQAGNHVETKRMIVVR